MVIKARCGACGIVDLPPEALTLYVFERPWIAKVGRYRLICNVCDRTTAWTASSEAMALLVSAGVPETVWDAPAELFESRYSGLPPTHDDILDFMLVLTDDELIEVVLAEWGVQARVIELPEVSHEERRTPRHRA